MLQIYEGELFLTQKLVQFGQAIEIWLGVSTVVQYHTDTRYAVQYLAVGTVLAFG